MHKSNEVFHFESQDKAIDWAKYAAAVFIIPNIIEAGRLAGPTP